MLRTASAMQIHDPEHGNLCSSLLRRHCRTNSQAQRSRPCEMRGVGLTMCVSGWCVSAVPPTTGCRERRRRPCFTMSWGCAQGECADGMQRIWMQEPMACQIWYASCFNKQMLVCELSRAVFFFCKQVCKLFEAVGPQHATMQAAPRNTVVRQARVQALV